MHKFVAKKGDVGEVYIVADETSKLILDLKQPADLAHAESVAEYLNKNVMTLRPGAKIEIISGGATVTVC